MALFSWVRDQPIKNEGSGRHPLLLPSSLSFVTYLNERKRRVEGTGKTDHLTTYILVQDKPSVEVSVVVAGCLIPTPPPPPLPQLEGGLAELYFSGRCCSWFIS